MKHLWKATVMAVILTLLGCFLPTHLQAQERYMEDNFDYTVGDLTDQGNWLSNRTSTNDILVEELAMSWENYATTTKAAHLPAISADKLTKQFNMDMITTGSVYYSFLLRVHNIEGSNYFIGLGQTGSMVTQVFGQVGLKKNTDDATKFHIGVGRAGAPNTNTEFSTETFDINEPLLVVVKYVFVDGEKNDEVLLYAAPALASEPETPTTRNANANANESSGINAIMLYPAGINSNKNAEVSISALRVSPTWEGLFAETPDVPTPKFSVQYMDHGGQFPVYVMQYTKTTAHFTIKAENLTGDVTIVPPTQEGISLDKTTLSKEALESAEGEMLTVTLDADKVNVNNQSAVIGFQTEGLENPYEYTLEWLVQTVEKPANIAALTATRINEEAFYALENLVVTYVDASTSQTDGLYKYYAQDATGGILIQDGGLGAFFGRVYEVGDRLPLVIGTVSPSSMMSTLSMTLLSDPGEAAAKQVAVEPAVVTLAELQTEKSRYACVLIKVENVEFYNRQSEATAEGKFKAAVQNYRIRQTEESQTIFNARTLNTSFASTDVPLKAHLVGVSTSSGGTVVGLRSPADITVVNTETPVDPDPDPDPDPEPGDETIAGDNLFTNAGFEAWDDADDFNEEGKPTDWELNMGTASPNTLDSYRIEGQKSLKVTTTGPLTNTLRQTVSAQFIEGKKYRIRLPYYIATGSDDGKNLQLLSYWQGPASAGEMDHDQNILNSGQYLTTKTGQWDTLEFITTAPASATAFYFAIRLNKNTTIYFDNFSFYRLEKAEDIKPQILVDTKFLGTIKAFLGEIDSSASVSVSGELLTAPVSVSVAGTDAAYFSVGKTQIELSEMPRTLKIYYAPKAAGFHHAELVFNSEGADEVRIALTATGQDANAKPQLSILPESLEAFTVSKPGETQTKRLMLSAMNMKDYVRAKVEGTDTGTFRLSNTMFLQNFENMPLDVTYMPRRAGEHSMTLVIYSQGDRIERRIPLNGICSEDAATDWVETFERVNTELTYGDQYVNGEKGSWHLVNAIGTDNETRDVFNGTRSIRLGKTEAKLEMDFDLMTGIDTLSFMVAASKDATESAKWRVETSSDFGLTWNAFGEEQSVGAAGVASTVVLEIKRAGVQRLRIVKTGETEKSAINIDDIRITSMPAVNLKWEELANLSEENPLDLLNESFTEKRHNKALAIEGWRNFIIKGDRPWWTYQQKDRETEEITEYMAKATAYNSLVDEASPYEMWLVTPALNGKKTGSKFFTFRVMGDLMLANQQSFLECYFIEPFADTMARSLIELNIPSIPDQNGEWFEYHMDMDLVEDLPDVFFIGFRFEGLGGRANSTVYYIDDVTYGREDIAHITASVAELSFEAMANKIAESDEIEIKGLNLTEDIRVSVGGANPSCFTPSVEVLPKQGGKLKVGFISGQTGIHSAWLKLSSKGAPDLYIDMEVRVTPSVPTIVVAEANKNIVLDVKAPATSATSDPIIVNPFFLTEAIALTIEGDDAELFSISRTSIPMDAYNETFTVSFTPKAQKPAGKCDIRLKSAGAQDVLIAVSGTSEGVANEDKQVFDVKVWRSKDAMFKVQAVGMREISVYTATGRVIYRDRKPADLKTFSLAEKPSGLYILEIRTADAVRRIRIVR